MNNIKNLDDNTSLEKIFKTTYQILSLEISMDSCHNEIMTMKMLAKKKFFFAMDCLGCFYLRHNEMKKGLHYLEKSCKLGNSISCLRVVKFVENKSHYILLSIKHLEYTFSRIEHIMHNTYVFKCLNDYKEIVKIYDHENNGNHINDFIDTCIKYPFIIVKKCIDIRSIINKNKNVVWKPFIHKYWQSEKYNNNFIIIFIMCIKNIFVIEKFPKNLKLLILENLLTDEKNNNL